MQVVEGTLQIKEDYSIALKDPGRLTAAELATRPMLCVQTSP